MKFNKTNKKLFKIFSAAGFALITCATTLFAFTPWANNNVQDTASSQIISLTPDTDETIYKTASGIEIKSHNVAGAASSNESKVQYFTMGSYNGTPLRWIILAGNPKLAENNSPAGSAINADSAKQKLSFKVESLLNENQLLVISEKVFDSFSLSFTPATSRTGSLPGSSSNGSGWKYGDNCGSNAAYYAGLLVDEAKDYYTAYPTNDDFTTRTNKVNELVTSTSLALNGFLDNKIVTNSNFSTNYGFTLTSTQLNNYLPSNIWQAKNHSDVNTDYWCSDEIKATINKSVSSNGTGGTINSNWGTGSGTCTWTGAFIDNTGSLISTFSTTTASIGHSNSSSRCYDKVIWTSSTSGYTIRGSVYVPTCTYKGETKTITAAFRPAMIVDFSKL